MVYKADENDHQKKVWDSAGSNLRYISFANQKDNA
jgi:hypothetical protein